MADPKLQEVIRVARFTETVNIGQAPTIQSDTTSLSNRLQNFADQQIQRHAQNVSQQQFAAGRAAFEEGEKPEFKEEKFFGRVGAEAYNKGLRASYVSSIDRDNREEVSRIVAENPKNLTGFNDAIESYRKSTLANVDPTARQVVSDSLDSLISSNRIRVQTNEIEATHQENNLETSSHVEAAANDALGFAREGDRQSAAESALAAFATIDGRVEAGFINAEQAKVQKREIEKDMVEEGLKGGLIKTFDDAGAQAAFDELDDLSDKVPKGFAPEEWDSFISKAQTDLNRKNARQKQIAKENIKAVQLDNSIERGFLFTNPNIPADPAKGGQDRKDVNNYYDSASPEWEGNVNELINNNVEFVKNTGLVPNQLISNMGASMRSGNTEQVTAMMEVMQRLQTESPGSVKDFDAESRAMSVQVSDAIRNGLEPELAVEAARKNTFGLTPTQKEEVRLASAGKKQSDKRISKLKEMVDDEFDPGIIFGGGRLFPSEPDIPPGMQAEYMSNFNNFMSITGSNIEQSEKLAFESTKNRWGVSNTGGPRRFMRGAPESFYHVDGFDDSWIDDQFISEAEELGIEDAIIGTDEQVFRSDSPSYPILAPNKDGILDIVEDENGKPRRFQPDIKLTQEYQDVVELPAKKLEKAKQTRIKNLQRRALKIQRSVNADLFRPNGFIGSIPKGERAELLATEEGRAAVRQSINNSFATGKIDQVEASEALRGFSAGVLSDLPGFDALVRSGKINADN